MLPELFCWSRLRREITQIYSNLTNLLIFFKYIRTQRREDTEIEYFYPAGVASIKKTLRLRVFAFKKKKIENALWGGVSLFIHVIAVKERAAVRHGQPLLLITIKNYFRKDCREGHPPVLQNHFIS